MKKIFTFLTVFLTLSISTTVFAQADTMFIAANPTPGTLRDAIIGDTMPDGSRNNAERVYELERGGIYFLSGVFNAGFDLKLFAQAPDDDNPPPVIAPSQAAGIDHNIICHGDVSFKNVYVTNISAGGTRNFGGILCFGEGHTYSLDSCVLEGNQWNGFVIFGPAQLVSITNSVFRNAVNAGSPWNGRGISTRDQPVEEVIIENNTFYNLNSFVFRGEWNEIKKLTFNRNTMVNTIKWPIQWHYATDATFNYNIFYNTHSFGESDSEKAGQDVDGQPFGIFNLFELDQNNFIDSLGYVEYERKVTLSHNNYFYSSEIQDFWTSIDSVDAEPWMNDRTQGMFDDDANYVSLLEVETTNMDPAFTEVGNTAAYSTIDSMVMFMRGLRDTNVVKPLYWGFEPDPAAAPFTVEWPLPENLAYTNTTLMTAGPGGCPIGDLNWWPGQKASCMLVGTNDPYASEGLAVEQNMPNPFRWQTTIAYTLADATDVNVSIIDINGRLVTSLVNAKQPQGRHTVEWNPTNQATGIYFYQIKTDNALITRKLELIK